jgi:hypothetical protein
MLSHLESPLYVYPQVDYVALLGALNESCKEMGIQDVKPFVEKVGGR